MGRLLCDRRACVCVCVCSAHVGARILRGRRLRRAPPHLPGCRAGGASRAFALACSPCSSGRRLPSPIVGRLRCGARTLLAGACILGRRRSCRAVQRAAAPAAWWASYARAPLCGPLVASRHPGDLKITTNPHYIHLGPTSVSIELRRTEFHKPGVETQFHKTLLHSSQKERSSCLQKQLAASLRRPGGDN